MLPMTLKKNIIKKPNAMKAKTGLSENSSDGVSRIKGVFITRLNKSFIILLCGLLFVSAMSVPAYMSYQTALQSLELATADHLESLVNGQYPTAYLTQGDITSIGEGLCNVVIFDAASINMLYSNNPALSQVELAKITANAESDLPASIDLSQLEASLPNLKYLLVEFGYDACGGNTEGCCNSILRGFVEGSSSQIMVIYNLSLPE